MVGFVVCMSLTYNFGIVEKLMAIVHTITATQNTVDGPSGNMWCDIHEPYQKIIPAATGTAKAVGKVILEPNGKLTGVTFLVPTSNVSIMDMTCCPEKATKKDEINKVVKKACKGPLKGILGCTVDQVVSCNFNSEPHTSIFDALNDNMVKLISWYNNKYDHMASQK